MYSKLHNVSGVTRVGGTYVVYVDTVKFLILWVYFHCYDLSCLQKIYPTLSMIESCLLCLWNGLQSVIMQ